MTLQRAIHQAALAAERTVDRLLPRHRRGKPLTLEPYRGHATPQTLVLRGRVLSHIRRSVPRPDQSRWTNFRQMVALFLTDEVADVPVRAVKSGVETRSDAEGYVWLEVPRLGRGPGWVDVAVEIVGQAGSAVMFPALVPRPDAHRGVISDIDDTMMRTGAYSLLRNLWTTFTGSALTREVFADSVALMRALHEDGRNPVFYVSSSPWNMHAFLENVFAGAGLPAGPMFLRDLGIAEDQFVASGHGRHKSGAIDTILTANPGLPFVLLGDTGQKDAQICLDAARRHPGRIAAVLLRQTRADADARARAAVEALYGMGIEAEIVADFTSAMGRYSET